VSGWFDAGFFGGIKDPADFNYPDPSGDSLLNFDEAPLGAGLDWAWQVNADGLTLMVVPEPGRLVLLGMGTLALLAYAWRRRRGR